MFKKFFLAFIVFTCALVSNAQQFHWAKTGVNYRAVAADKSGNVYMLGYVQGTGTVDVDPGPGVFNVNGSMTDMNCPFVLKLDKYGDFVWAYALLIMTYDNQWELAVDDSQNVYIAGRMHVSMFDPGIMGYVKRLNSNGSAGWEIMLGMTTGVPNTTCNDVAVDSMGNVYVTGRSNPTIDIDPGPNTVSISGKFTIKYTNTGDYVWHDLNGSELIEASRDGNAIYVVGPVGSGYDYPTQITKLNGGGSPVWNRSFDSISFKKLDIAEEGKMYATGFFMDTTDFDPGLGVSELATAGGSDQFLLKMDTAGSFIWVTQLGSSATDQGKSVVLDGKGHIYTCGTFSGTVDMDAGTAVNNLTSIAPATADIFVQKLDTAGSYIWAAPIGTNAIDVSHGMAIDTSGAIFIIGEASGADLDPGTPLYTLPPTNTFVTKWSDTMEVVSVKESLNGGDKILVYPNPSGKTINVSAAQAIDDITIIDIAGRLVYKATPFKQKTVIDILHAGVYFISITSDGKVSREKVLIR